MCFKVAEVTGIATAIQNCLQNLGKHQQICVWNNKKPPNNPTLLFIHTVVVILMIIRIFFMIIVSVCIIIPFLSINIAVLKLRNTVTKLYNSFIRNNSIERTLLFHRKLNIRGGITFLKISRDILEITETKPLKYIYSFQKIDSILYSLYYCVNRAIEHFSDICIIYIYKG